MGLILRDGRNMGKKTMLLGIAVILATIALSISNIIAFVGGIAGLLIAIVGFSCVTMRSNTESAIIDCIHLNDTLNFDCSKAEIKIAVELLRP